MKEVRPSLKITHGGMQVEVKPKKRINPMVKLQRFIQKNNLRLVDFFNKFDKDGSMSVTYDEFEEGLKVSLSMYISMNVVYLSIYQLVYSHLVYNHLVYFSLGLLPNRL